MTDITLELIYLAPVSLCYKYPFFYNIFLIHTEASICVLEKTLFKFLEHSLAFQKIFSMNILGSFPVKHQFWSPSFKYIRRPNRSAKDHSAQEVHAHFRRAKESMPQKFQACADVCACHRMTHVTKPQIVILFFWMRICVAQ